MYSEIIIVDGTSAHRYKFPVCMVRKMEHLDIYIGQEYLEGLEDLDWDSDELEVFLKGSPSITIYPAKVFNKRVISEDTILSVQGNIKYKFCT